MLLDIRMPVMDGFDVLAWVRDQEQFRSLPVFILTSSNALEDSAMANALGATGYLVKGFGFREVAATIGRALRTAG